MSTSREARQDASEYARSRMYYGEGAGTRRKLIEAKVESKIRKSPKYANSFLDELGRQDMEEHADKAQRERSKADRHESVRRNTRAILTGNHKNAQTGILIVILVGTFAHRTGYDKVLYEKSKVWYQKAKDRFKKPPEPAPFRIVND